ncbi:GlsB/YeaQ/YmgE family stress response membrane protein [Allorhizocola rhizosphaerae]|uniref:GlsB/YeaQ/YmgE family stress response membrane protein n=1 Tax=Allorhizocola rhizosphaerae TaxID=1872709 RepID=UPI000E3D7017|nr:GlsB/YeaQ/YmgE family stress response membrane protein [Allorhizocola rhizosphaerae]
MLGTILWGIIGGAIIGILARLLLPGRQNISMLMTVIVGILAATLGGLLADWLGVGETAGIDWWRHIIQIALAVLGVWLVARMSSGRRGTTPPARPVTR